MPYNKKYHEDLKKSVKNASKEMKPYWQDVLDAYEELYPLNVKFNNLKKNDKTKS